MSEEINNISMNYYKLQNKKKYETIIIYFAGFML